jgi:hypothetical protein
LRYLGLLFLMLSVFVHASFANPMDKVVFDYYTENIQKNVLVQNVFSLLLKSNAVTQKWSDDRLRFENQKWQRDLENHNFEAFKRIASHEVSLLAGRIKLLMSGGVYNVTFLDNKGVTVAASDILQQLWFGGEVGKIKSEGRDFWVQNVAYDRDSREFETVAFFALNNKKDTLGYLRVSFDAEELDRLLYNHENVKEDLNGQR